MSVKCLILPSSAKQNGSLDKSRRRIVYPSADAGLMTSELAGINAVASGPAWTHTVLDEVDI